MKLNQKYLLVAMIGLVFSSALSLAADELGEQRGKKPCKVVVDGHEKTIGGPALAAGGTGAIGEAPAASTPAAAADDGTTVKKNNPQ